MANSSLQADAKGPLRLLKQIPSEVRRDIFLFCDGKSLSTLLLAASSCSFHRSVAWDEVPAVTRRRLQGIAARVSKHAKGSRDEKCLREAAEWILSVSCIAGEQTTARLDEQDDSEKTEKIALRMKAISENLAVLDFLDESLAKYSKETEGQFEWPVWCGQLTVDSFVTGTRMRNTARVVITSPMQRPSLMPGSSLMKNWTPCSVFRCEPYNLIPVPPWGQIRGLQPEDDHVLLPVASRLAESGEVATPSGFHVYQVLDVRIVTKEQARRLWPMIQGLKSSWLVQKEAEIPLLCCWQDDDSGELSDDREYIDYILDLLHARSRLCKSAAQSPREYLVIP
jgi:hypothetical protein